MVYRARRNASRPKRPPAPGAKATGTPAALELEGAAELPPLPIELDDTVAVPLLVPVVEAVPEEPD